MPCCVMFEVSDTIPIFDIQDPGIEARAVPGRHFFPALDFLVPCKVDLFGCKQG